MIIINKKHLNLNILPKTFNQIITIQNIIFII